MMAADPEGYFHIVSKDTDFDSVVRHLKGEKKLIARRASLAASGFADYAKFAIAHPVFSFRHFSFYSRMADVFTPEKRTEVMSSIRGCDT